ncbi:hypothetical protein CYMTET_54940 [Cymbomonas tetramitiformis]|uniref:Uncharacterized protein n=1 Tax=Cymbomonas tetramitiformis TaxID=36881 RepID=A0AAE0EQ76_9CHLO|nr:hypothetical protein CYMTET_54940 [Cymbomonas tetramitiformis]
MSDHFPTLVRSTYDECLYIRERKRETEKRMVIIYVDDFLVGCSDEQTGALFHSALMIVHLRCHKSYSDLLQQFLQLKIRVTTTATSDSGQQQYPAQIDVSHDHYDITDRSALYQIPH